MHRAVLDHGREAGKLLSQHWSVSCLLRKGHERKQESMVLWRVRSISIGMQEQNAGIEEFVGHSQIGLDSQPKFWSSVIGLGNQL